MVGDYFKLKLVYTDYIEKATELIKWINNHSLALAYLRAQQEVQRRVALALVLPVLTRWTSHSYALGRLLELQPFIMAMVSASYPELLNAAGKTREARAKAEEVLGYVQDPLFWRHLERCV